MMAVVPFTVLRDRLECGESIPHSSIGLGVPVTELPESSKVVFFSHTRLMDQSPDNKHNVKLRGLVQAMTTLAEEGGISPENTYAWIDEACIDQETWSKHPDLGMAYV